METKAFAHFVFVDFENVPKVDLAIVQGPSVHVTLLIGKKQTKLDLSLVQQMRRVPDQVELVEVGASGHNALDMTLACYLGQAVQRTPAAQFTIVSKDKDFEPMIGHLSGKGTKVIRCDTFAAAFQPAPRKPAAAPKATPPAKALPAPKPVPTSKKQKSEEKFLKLITHLKLNHPKTQATLARSIATYYGNKLTLQAVEDVLEELKSRNVLAIDDAGKVSYA